MSNYQQAIKKAIALLGEKNVQSHDATAEVWVLNSYADNKGEFAFVAFPKDNKEIIGLIEIAREFGMKIVPQGGNTGRCDGATPKGEQNILLNLTRMNKIISLDSTANLVQVEAGCILQDIKDVAESENRFFPLGLGSQGSCTIGGNIATNAGGINTVRYGNCREQVLGLEAILPNGEVWDGMRILRKDNTGYDLKHLFIGSEGTLGIITKASLRLYPLAQALTTAMVAVKDLPQALDLFASSSDIFGSNIIAFEVMPRIAQEFVTQFSDYKLPLHDMYDWVVIMQVEHTSTAEAESGQSHFAEMLEKENLTSALLAVNETQRQEIWRLRELTTAVQTKAGLTFKHDISLPIASIPSFYKQAVQEATKLCKGVRTYAYGHLGDGNLHYNLTIPEGMKESEYEKQRDTLSSLIYDLVAEYNGSFSAEHGVGRSKSKLMRKYKSPLEWEMQRKIKASFDPDNLFNAGVIFDD